MATNSSYFLSLWTLLFCLIINTTKADSLILESSLFDTDLSEPSDINGFRTIKCEIVFLDNDRDAIGDPRTFSMNNIIDNIPSDTVFIKFDVRPEIKFELSPHEGGAYKTDHLWTVILSKEDGSEIKRTIMQANFHEFGFEGIDQWRPIVQFNHEMRSSDLTLTSSMLHVDARRYAWGLEPKAKAGVRETDADKPRPRLEGTYSIDNIITHRLPQLTNSGMMRIPEDTDALDLNLSGKVLWEWAHPNIHGRYMMCIEYLLQYWTVDGKRRTINLYSTSVDNIGGGTGGYGEKGRKDWGHDNSIRAIRTKIDLPHMTIDKPDLARPCDGPRSIHGSHAKWRMKVCKGGDNPGCAIIYYENKIPDWKGDWDAEYGPTTTPEELKRIANDKENIFDVMIVSVSDPDPGEARCPCSGSISIPIIDF